jgi:hypothetical protein
MNQSKQLADALKQQAKPSRLLAKLHRKVLAEAWEEARQAVATAGDGEQADALALLHEIESAIAYAEIENMINEGPSMAERLQQRRERAGLVPVVTAGPCHD